MAEHPEDKKLRIEGEEYGRAHCREFATEFATEMEMLIGTYPDGEAQEKLTTLRERFWAEIWKPKAKRGLRG